MAPRRAGLTLDEFRRHYREVHAGVADQVPGVRRYVQWHPLTDEAGRRPLAYPGFDACSTMEFADFADLEAGFASSTYQGRVRDDERAFVDPTLHSRIVGVHLIEEEMKPDQVALVGLWRRHPEANREQLRVGIETWAKQGEGRVVEIVEGLEAPPDGRPNAADLMTVRAFDTIDAAVAWAHHDGSVGNESWPLARLVFGSAMFVARPHRVR